MGKTLDSVVSTMAIHNVRIPAIIECIYKEVYELLKPNGCFLNLDLVFVPLAKQLGWLRSAGFVEVKSYWRAGKKRYFGEASFEVSWIIPDGNHRRHQVSKRRFHRHKSQV